MVYFLPAKFDTKIDTLGQVNTRVLALLVVKERILGLLKVVLDIFSNVWTLFSASEGLFLRVFLTRKVDI